MHKFFALLICFSLCAHLGAQERIEVVSGMGVESLVKNIFIKGNCRNVRNIKAIGNQELSIGQFKNGADNINIMDGIIMSTGTIELARGPNTDNEAGFGFNIQSEDADLSQSATSTLFDVTGIEFDFVPLADRIAFKYVFASEEYCEFVGTEFNDVFGFFVTGPGINGNLDNNALNVASIVTLNGTEEIVSINSINHLQNETFYVSNITSTDAQNCQINFVPSFQDYVEYDGFTIPLIASFSVIPCETYRIRLVIGDVGDPILDSAVFLESKSFDLGEDVSITAEVPGRTDSIAYEGCANGQFVFRRNDLADINQDFTVDLKFSADSEAINGVDFEEIPMSITIPAGDTSFILPITIIEDNLLEGPEKLKLEAIYDCDCIDAAFSELIINEPSEMVAEFGDINACLNQSIDISPIINGGVPPYQFLWETGETDDTLTISVEDTARYDLMIKDFCGDSVSTTAIINIQDIPRATLDGSFDFCQTSIEGIPILLEGNPPWSLQYSINGSQRISVRGIYDQPYLLNTLVEGTYELTSFRDAYCEGDISGTAVTENPIEVITDIVQPSCSFRSDGSISIISVNSNTAYTIEWLHDGSSSEVLENINQGTYILRIIDDNGCVLEEAIELTALSDDIQDCLSIYIPNVFAPNNNGNNDVFSIVFADNSGIQNIDFFKVYNRWGALIYEQTNIPPVNGAILWDGTFEAKPLNPGVYVYKVLIALDDQTTLVLSGDITLLR